MVVRSKLGTPSSRQSIRFAHVSFPSGHFFWGTKFGIFLHVIPKGDVSIKIVKKALRRMKKLKKWLRAKHQELEPLTAADLARIVPGHKETAKKVMENNTSFSRIGVTDNHTVGSDAIAKAKETKTSSNCSTM